MRKPFGDDYLRSQLEGFDWEERDTYKRTTGVRPVITPELRGTFRSLSSILTPEGGVLLSEADLSEGENFNLDEYDAGEIDES